MNIIALDPGSEKTAILLFDSERRCIASHMILPNDQIIGFITTFPRAETLLAVEMIASYGMAVGKEVFETCLWIGRFIQAWGGKHRLVYRKDIKLHLCQNMRAKDANIRQALLDRFGGKDAVGLKRSPGPLYGIKSHLWSALAVAVYASDTKVAA